MKIVKWVLGTLLSYTIAVGLLVLIIDVEDTLSKTKNLQLFNFVHGFDIILVFTAVTILNCLFVPRPKKYAALLSTIVILIIAFLEMYSNIAKNGIYSISYKFIISYMCLFAGLCIGTFVSSLIFKNKGWNQQTPKSEVADSY
ncbi:MAG: hypothetical protein V4456_20535 [Bacteroidota bacterium]